jgi:hypothetical protein
MSYTNPAAYESGSMHFRKKVKGLSLLVPVPFSKIIWKPRDGEILTLVEAYYRQIKLRPSNVGVPQNPTFTLTDGTNDVSGQFTVYADNFPEDSTGTRHIYVPATPYQIDNTHPLTLLQIGDQGEWQEGFTMATTWDYELILIAAKISD